MLNFNQSLIILFEKIYKNKPKYESRTQADFFVLNIIIFLLLHVIITFRYLEDENITSYIEKIKKDKQDNCKFITTKRQRYVIYESN